MWSVRGSPKFFPSLYARTRQQKYVLAVCLREPDTDPGFRRGVATVCCGVGPRRGRTPRLRWKLAPRLSRCSLWLSCSKVRFVGMLSGRLRCVCTLALARPGVGRFGGGVGWGSRRSLPDGRQQVRGFLLPRNSIRLCCIFLCVLCALLRWWISRCRRAPRRCLYFLELSALFRRLPCRNPSPFENQGYPQALGRPELQKNPVCSRCCRFRIHSPPGIFRKHLDRCATPPEGLRKHRISPQNTRQSLFAGGFLSIFYLPCRVSLSRFSQLLRVLCCFSCLRPRPCAQGTSACSLVSPGLFPKRWRYLPPLLLPPPSPHLCKRVFLSGRHTPLEKDSQIRIYRLRTAGDPPTGANSCDRGSRPDSLPWKCRTIGCFRTRFPEEGVLQRIFCTGGPFFGRFVLSLYLLCLRLLLHLRLRRFVLSLYLLCLRLLLHLRFRKFVLSLYLPLLCLRLLLHLRFRTFVLSLYLLCLCLLLHRRLRLLLLRLWLLGKIELQHWQVGELFRCRNPLVFVVKPCLFVFVSFV